MSMLSNTHGCARCAVMSTTKRRRSRARPRARHAPPDIPDDWYCPSAASQARFRAAGILKWCASSPSTHRFGAQMGRRQRIPPFSAWHDYCEGLVNHFFIRSTAWHSITPSTRTQNFTAAAAASTPARSSTNSQRRGAEPARDPDHGDEALFPRMQSAAASFAVAPPPPGRRSPR